MITYKGYYIWHNSLRGNKPWLLQSGGEIIGQYKTISAAKRMATILNHEDQTVKKQTTFKRYSIRREYRGNLWTVVDCITGAIVSTGKKKHARAAAAQFNSTTREVAQ